MAKEWRRSRASWAWRKDSLSPMILKDAVFSWMVWLMHSTSPSGEPSRVAQSGLVTLRSGVAVSRVSLLTESWLMTSDFLWFISICNSACGRAEMSCHPLGVHCFRVFSPKSASHANLTARIPILLYICNSGYFCSTSEIDLSPALSISSAASSQYLGFTGPIGLGMLQ